MEFVAFAGAVLAVAVGIWLSRRRRHRPQERELLRLVNGDERTLESLVAGEQKRQPQLSRAQAVKRVTSRLRHERAR